MSEMALTPDQIAMVTMALNPDLARRAMKWLRFIQGLDRISEIDGELWMRLVCMAPGESRVEAHGRKTLALPNLEHDN